VEETILNWVARKFKETSVRMHCILYQQKEGSKNYLCNAALFKLSID